MFEIKTKKMRTPKILREVIEEGETIQINGYYARVKEMSLKYGSPPNCPCLVIVMSETKIEDIKD